MYEKVTSVPKAITIEMLEAMSPDQRKTLHQNALARETPAAREIIAMLTEGDLLKRPAANTTSASKPRTTAAKKKQPAKHGRQS